MESGPQGEEEVLYWNFEAVVSSGSVGSVIDHAELSFPGDGSLPQAGPWRRYEVKMNLAVQYTAEHEKVNQILRPSGKLSVHFLLKYTRVDICSSQQVNNYVHLLKYLSTVSYTCS